MNINTSDTPGEPEKVWDGQFVSRALNIHPKNESEGYEDLLGLALRKNKKRAHLLVSSVLGKYIPQRPHIIESAGQALAVQMMVHNAEVSTGAFGEDEQAELRHTLRRNLVAAMRDGGKVAEFGPVEPFEKVLVFGYAETATSLGAIVAEKLQADYVHSTRYPVAGVTNYGIFDEPHSHASLHHVTASNPDVLDDPGRTLVLVDDEMSTGNTVMNTIRLFHSRAPRESYYIGTLTDLRDETARSMFREFEEELGITVTVVSLLTAELTVPADRIEAAGIIVEAIKAYPEVTYDKAGTVSYSKFVTDCVPNFRLGAYSDDSPNHWGSVRDLAVEVAAGITVKPGEKVLFLGIEESMTLPLFVASEMEQREPESLIHSTSSTRAPVVTFHEKSYAVRERIRYELPDREIRYGYNIDDSYDRIVVLFCGDDEVKRHAGLIDALAVRAEFVNVVTVGLDSSHPVPLSGPEFGSYDKNDVQWLLKDLSHAQLETSLEDREEAIQNGGAHYAESLPQEFVPSEEYTELFKKSLQENKRQLAENVAVVSELIYKERNRKPVIVSLARAGVPAGILMKRYLKEAHKYEAPHYAISIVRGKGIDRNALNYIAAHHNPEDVIFVDGWTGKGAITFELSEAVELYKQATGVQFNPELAVITDPGSAVRLYGTRDDNIIPSACLNSTVSGLISRTVLNESFINADDYHGAKFYAEFREADLSNLFLNTVSGQYAILDANNVAERVNELLAADRTPTWAGWKKVEELSVEYGINNVNLVKPGVGETTRVLLRRVPWRILVRPDAIDDLTHVLMLAAERGVEVEEREDLPYACVGLVHPNFTKGAVGFDGKAA